MERKLVITKQGETVISSLLEEGEITELHCYQKEKDTPKAVLGNIYIGKVKKIVANINAAFVDIGGCECYYSLADHHRSITLNRSSARKPITVGDELLVQVQKEAVKSKAPTVTGNLNLQGKYAVLTTGISKIGVSAKIGSKRRKELLELMEEYQSADYGFVVRTNAREAAEERLLQEIHALIDQYHHLIRTAANRTCYSCLYQNPSDYLGDIRNLYQGGLTEILTEDTKLYEEIADFLNREQPEDAHKLRLYSDPGFPLHKLYSVETALSQALQKKVWLKSGGYLVIEPTEALTVIDVNSGRSIHRKGSSIFLDMNLEAAREAAKQIRLRNLSGIILVDFINLDDPLKMSDLLEQFRRYLKADPVPTTLVDVTKLQLVEITRKKIKRPLHESI